MNENSKFNKPILEELFFKAYGRYPSSLNEINQYEDWYGLRIAERNSLSEISREVSKIDLDNFSWRNFKIRHKK
jgi:hypothetical protein